MQKIQCLVGDDLSIAYSEKWCNMCEGCAITRQVLGQAKAGVEKYHIRKRSLAQRPVRSVGFAHSNTFASPWQRRTTGHWTL